MTKQLETHLARRNALSEEERTALRDMPVERRTYAHAERIVAEGLAPEGSCMLVDGMAMRVHRVGRTERVVSALHVPGDFVDLHSFLLDHLDHDIVAIGPCMIDFVASDHLEALTRDYPRLARLLWRATLIDAKMHRVWIVTRAALRGTQRIGHLICELHARLAAVGLTRESTFAMPLDQRGLAQVLGYSVVHVNHAVRDLRAEGLLEWAGGRIHLPNPEGLARFADFDPAYLELHNAELQARKLV
ncbi:Crp/Fnr family transcriptional regulator [Palleronia sp. LCG004]|uniref:Crp/Fnr family transcriptional regulator n=1 Tax=Palleronia sp. LCG004 TaxID=3079304 RepID=UPI002942D0BC|nr:Crp/Fnr family transcriptional regulator [Palleronia sp. LCG004]WOI56977.1 Crp/Fnr family transcriptional regulator [Palleronia sp. LCG004]